MLTTNSRSDIDSLQCHPSEMESTEFSYFADVAGTNAPSAVFLSTNIGKGIEKILSEGLTREVMDNVSAKYTQPSNCPRLSVLGCSPEVFRHVSARARFRDSSLQTVQQSLISGITAVAFALETVMQQSQNEDVKEKLSDRVALLSNAYML